MKKIFNRKALGVIALALVCVLAGTAIGATRPSAEAETVVLTSPFTEAIAKVRDSVVGVYNYQLVNYYSYGNNYSNGYGIPWDFFGYGNSNGNGYGNGNGNGRNQQPEASEVKYASGSGTVIAKEYVLTNYHVIEDASSLKISVGGDDTNLYEATAVATDPDTDVAVLYVPGLPLEPVELGDSDQLQIGDWVVNIGNAIGFTGTATAGIVSGIDRAIKGDTTTTDRFGRKSTVVNTMIQTDAAINSGNSGGGMFNTAGQLVGIPTLKYSGTRYSSGAMIESIGMCIPINEAKDVIEEALNSGKPQAQQEQVTEPEQQEQPEQPETDGTEEAAGQAGGRIGKPRMGVTVATLPDTNGVLPYGAYILKVEEGSPAEKAGLKPGDIVVDVNGQVVNDSEGLMSALDPFQEGDTVKVTVWRPTTVNDAENVDISIGGDYVENIEVALAMLDGVAQ